MNKPSAAFLLGLLSFFLLMFVGATAGLPAAFAVLAVYSFVCQFVLSRGNPAAWRTDWRIMLALDAVPLAVVVIMTLVEGRGVLLSQGLGILLACCGGTFAGAAAASRVARGTTARR